MLKMEGWQVNHKRVERTLAPAAHLPRTQVPGSAGVWRQEGLKVPRRQPKRGRSWLNDGSCLRLRLEYPDPVWSFDFISGRNHDGRAFRMLNVIDRYTRKYLPEGH